VLLGPSKDADLDKILTSQGGAESQGYMRYESETDSLVTVAKQQAVVTGISYDSGKNSVLQASYLRDAIGVRGRLLEREDRDRSRLC